jgi:hypothetical protein
MRHTDRMYLRIISSILLLCAISGLATILIATSAHETVLSLSIVTFVAGSLGFAIADAE